MRAGVTESLVRPRFARFDMYFNTQLFNRGEAEVYQLFSCDLGGLQFKHTIGGKSYHKGTIPPGCRQRVHLFYELDLADPLIEVRPPQPEVTRLPLYYPLGNSGGMFKYRVVSDKEIDMLSLPYPKPERDIPKPYPKPFPPGGIFLQPIDFDPKDPEWLWNYGGILGVGKLTATEKATTRKKFESWHQKTFKYPLLDRYHKNYGEEEDPNLDEIVRIFTPFTQGMPEVICPNTKCNGHKEQMSLPALAYLTPEDDEDDEDADGGAQRVFKLLAGGDSGQLIWMVCPLCMSVVVDNPCT